MNVHSHIVLDILLNITTLFGKLILLCLLTTDVLSEIIASKQIRFC